jgi:hypothetical protein
VHTVIKLSKGHKCLYGWNIVRGWLSVVISVGIWDGSHYFLCNGGALSPSKYLFVKRYIWNIGAKFLLQFPHLNTVKYALTISLSSHSLRYIYTSHPTIRKQYKLYLGTLPNNLTFWVELVLWHDIKALMTKRSWVWISPSLFIW